MAISPPSAAWSPRRLGRQRVWISDDGRSVVVDRAWLEAQLGTLGPDEDEVPSALDLGPELGLALGRGADADDLQLEDAPTEIARPGDLAAFAPVIPPMWTETRRPAPARSWAPGLVALAFALLAVAAGVLLGARLAPKGGQASPSELIAIP